MSRPHCVRFHTFPCEHTRTDWIPVCGCDPACGSRAPDRQSLSTAASTAREIRDWLDRPSLPRLATLQEYDRRCERPTTAINTENNSHPRFVRLPRTSRIPRLKDGSLRTRCMWRFTTLHALPRLDSRLRGIFFRAVCDSAMTSQAVISSSLASDAPVASSVSVRSLVRTVFRLGRDHFSCSPREEEYCP